MENYIKTARTKNWRGFGYLLNNERYNKGLNEEKCMHLNGD
jgi:hypothetical protein